MEQTFGDGLGFFRQEVVEEIGRDAEAADKIYLAPWWLRGTPEAAQGQRCRCDAEQAAAAASAGEESRPPPWQLLMDVQRGLQLPARGRDP